MLFLARGRAPVLINKIQYDGPWNQRPRDVANFVRWMGTQTERQRDINWQISNLDISEADLHDAPFLYLSGNKALNLKSEQIEKLKQFAQHGGMLLFNSDCGSDVGAQNPLCRIGCRAGQDDVSSVRVSRTSEQSSDLYQRAISQPMEAQARAARVEQRRPRTDDPHAG